jgi:hypothetical protein
MSSIDEDSGNALARRLAGAPDRLAATDPGLNRLLAAVQLAIGMTVTLVLVYLFMQATHLMWVTAPAGAASTPAVAAGLAAQHHGITVLAMLLGGIVAMLTSFGVMDPRPRDQALTMVLMPIPALATLSLSIALVPHHTLGVALLAVVMGIGTYLRRFVPRFGSRMVLYGILLFIGYIFGFLSNGALAESQVGDLAIVIAVAVAINLLLKVLVERRFNEGRLGRMIRSFRSRARAVVVASIDLFDPAVVPERAARRLHRRLRLLNETALVIDGSISDPAALPSGSSPQALHDELFDVELVVHNVARIAERLAGSDLPAPVRDLVRGWLRDLRSGSGEGVAAAFAAREEREGPALLAGVAPADDPGVRRLALEISSAAQALAAFPRIRQGEAQIDPPFSSSVTLLFGQLPGSALVSARAAAPGDGRRGALLRRLHLDPPAQTAIRVMLAVGAASALGSMISERRFYWAVIAVFIAFMGTNTSGEQVRKAIYRVGGTVVGILVGSLLAHAIGHSTWSLPVIVFALCLGTYFMKVNYGLMVIGITVVVSQLYEQLGEYSNHLLVLRLEETSVGAVVAAVAALLIFPVDTRRATRVAAHAELTALAALLRGAGARLRERPEEVALTGASRALDHAHQQLLATSRSLSTSVLHRERLEHNLGLFTQTTHHARNLVANVAREQPGDVPSAAGFAQALDRESEMVGALAASIERDERPAPPLRLQDAVFPRLAVELADGREQLLPHRRSMMLHLDRLDEAVAELAVNLAAGRGGPPPV